MFLLEQVIHPSRRQGAPEPVATIWNSAAGDAQPTGSLVDLD